MPEAFACLFVFIVSVAAYVGARFYAADSGADSGAELMRLRNQRAFLLERLQKARRENWGPEMTDQIFEELELIEARLAGNASVERDSA